MRINLNDFNIYDHVIRDFSSSEELILDYRLESVFRLINFPDAVANCFSCLEHVHTRILTSDYDPEYVKKSIRNFPQVYKHINEVEIFPFGHLERIFRRSEMIESYNDYHACCQFQLSI